MAENILYQGAVAVFCYRIENDTYSFDIKGHKNVGKNADDWKIGLALNACHQILKEKNVNLDEVKMTLTSIEFHEKITLSALTIK
jgi:hypothetical protein